MHPQSTEPIAWAAGAQPAPKPVPQPKPTVENPMPSRIGPQHNAMRYDRADLDDTVPVPPGVQTIPAGTRHPATIPVADPLCGHLPGEPHDGSCDYWRGVALGEYPAPDGMPGPVGLPPFDLRQLAAEHITAAEQDRRERGAA
ncbi:hypothetical protein [Micromonospora tulbaghiae]|uniref:hypothetical protein n=1 Tax=Micromonospora tulbaghiae TaxID=479978 RepID=UPI002681AA81